MMGVKPEVKRHIFLAYINRCRELHAIAFLQWRKKYQKEVKNKYESITFTDADFDELLLTSINILNHEDNMKLYQRPLPKTTEMGAVNPQFYKNFESMLNHRKYESYYINQFWDLGWADPFPEDDKVGGMPDTADLSLPTKPDDLVYEECRYVEKYSPYCIYIPKKDLMIKLMRSCLGV